jgi:choline kinase
VLNKNKPKSAIIFAAGMAKRLGDLTINTAKACLQLADNWTLLDRQIERIAANNFSQITIVTGHAQDSIIKVCEKWQNKIQINLIFNKHYFDRNNIYTAYIVKDLIGDNVLILNSDIIVANEIIDSACQKLSDNKSFMVIDVRDTLIDEDMKVTVNESNYINRINKNLDNSKSLGEYIGIMSISSQDQKAFAKSLEDMIAREDFNKYYEDALDEITDKLQLEVLPTQGFSWTEMDTVEDYQKAKNIYESFLKTA